MIANLSTSSQWTIATLATNKNSFKKQPVTNTMQKGIREVQKCQNSAIGYVI
jgi:hypothetical protein